MVRIGWTAWMAGPISMQARHEVVAAHFDRYRAGTRGEKRPAADVGTLFGATTLCYAPGGLKPVRC